jgi:hypothetical protein
MTRAQLRDRLQARNERVGEALDRLEQLAVIERTPAGWKARPSSAGSTPPPDGISPSDPTAFPVPHLGVEGSGTPLVP